jgi:hypothetical protein
VRIPNATPSSKTSLKLAGDYDIADHCSTYRQVHSTGLYPCWCQSIRAALETILERSDED